MRFSISLAVTFALAALAADDPFKKYTIKADGIEASFIGYGATLTNLLVNDKDGNPQDVVVGYDDGRQYLQDSLTNHTYFGPIVGRYANRIKNGTFTVQGVTSHVPENEHQGHNTLHGGKIGYDQRNWTVEAYNDTTITFSFLDQAYEGFPGSVLTHATYSVQPRRWTSRLVSIPLDAPTPIMLSNHIYWNLDAFTTGPGANVLSNTLHMPYAARLIATDNIQVPTGGLEVVAGTPFDFTVPKALGQDVQSAQKCGFNCTGYDNAFVLDRPRGSGTESTEPVMLSLASPATGIRMDLRTDQACLQVYNCIGQNGTIGVKRSQQHGGDAETFVEKFGCVVIEPQQWIDGINHPEWGQDQLQIFSPETGPAVNFVTYDFSTVA